MSALQRADFGNDRRLALGYNQLRSQLTNLKLQKTDNSDVVTNISYDYYNGGGGSGGNNGRVRYITDHVDGNYSVDVGYDDHNRLTSYGSYRSYTYDAWNNLLSVSSSNGVGEAPNYTLTYATNGSGAPSTNRINNSGYAYDNAGNVTNDGSLAYAYDAAGRLKTAGTNNSCEYDGDGRKVKQVSGGYPLFYLWSSVLGEPVVELDGSGGVYRAYVLSSGGQTIAVQSYDGGFYWLHTDHLGNGRKLTNSSGTVIYRAEFDPHGQMLYEWQSSGQTYLNSHKFTGYERDWATNLNYAKARTYNHNRARFMQPDPLGLAAADRTNPQSLNQYSYVHNDPMNFVDPDGLNARMCFGYYVSISNDGGESWTTIGFIPVFCWDVGGGGGSEPQNPANFPPVNTRDVESALNMAREMLKRKECDESLKDSGIPSLSALLNGLKFSGPNANVFDGRTSSLSLPIGQKNRQQTVADYFKTNKKSVGAAVFHDIHGQGDGDVTFLGHGFYSPEHQQWTTQQQAIILLHEAVHQVGKKGDAVFKGSKALSEKIIQGCYPALKGKLGGVG